MPYKNIFEYLPVYKTDDQKEELKKIRKQKKKEHEAHKEMLSEYFLRQGWRDQE